jgi:hypothetical protein
MGFKCVIIAFALVVCLSNVTFGQSPKDSVVQPFPEDGMSGSEIYREVQGGVYTDPTDTSLSFRDESLFLINKHTGMTPNAIGTGVRTPVKIFSIDVRTRDIHVVLTNSRPAGHVGWR